MTTRMKPRMTMLELIQAVQSDARSDEEVVERVIRLVNRGTVTLCGNFAGCRF